MRTLASVFAGLRHPPEFASGELTLAVRTVHRAVCLTVIVITFFIGCLIVLQPDTLGRRILTILSVIVLGVLLLIVNRRGMPRLASILLVAGLTLILTFRAFTSGGMSAPALTGFVIITMIASLLLGFRTGLLVAAVHAVLTLGMVLAEHQGLLPESELVFTPFALWIYLCFWLGLAVILQIQIAGTLRDALVRAQAELAERRKTEHRLQAALEVGNIAVWELDPETRHVIGDDRLFKLFGLPPAPDGHLPYETWSALVHKEDYPRVDAVLTRLKSAGQVERAGFRIIHPDGSVHYTEGIGSLIGAGDGRPGKVVGMNLDVTERHASEQERARLLFNLGERVKELRLLHQSARLLRRDRPPDESLFRELVGLMPPAWQYPDDCEARISYGDIQVATPGWRDSGVRLSTTFEASTGSGSLEVIYRSAHPAADEGPFLKEEKALLVSLADMLVSYLEMQRKQEDLESLVAIRTRELKESYDRLQRLEQLRDDLVNMVVHDMRSPLTVVTMRLDLLQHVGKAGLSPDALVHLKSARESAEVVVRMARDLLDVSRMEENKLSLSRSTVDLTALLQGIVQSLSSLDVRRGFEIDPAYPVEVSCDSALITRVLENLIGNAIKHTPVGSAIRIAITQGDGAVRVAISDCGKGIPAEAQAKLFRKFGTVESRSGGSHHSVGLGLVFCKMVVEAHGGSIGVESAVGRGSTFWFDLPKN
ncbi:MAG: PAS domain-containing protein [Opitutaceae bacterium]|nr:PAS domain-containing protein [Opitutaceae bacterium]